MDYKAFYYELNRAGQKTSLDSTSFIDPGNRSERTVKDNTVLVVYRDKEAENRGDLSLFQKQGADYQYICDIDKCLWLDDAVIMGMIRINGQG